jgi:hypothetical protein
MAELIEFTGNYNDLSTQQGFQWEFFCERCGNGYRSAFRPACGAALEASARFCPDCGARQG